MQISQAMRHDAPIDFAYPLLDVDRDMPVILVAKTALAAMYEHACGEMHHEVGGYLLGFPLLESSTRQPVTYIEETVWARYDSTPTHVTLHAESFVDLERVRGNRIMVGYYHSHPGLGIFLSGTDVRNFSLYHPESYQIAVVVDPSKTARRDLTAHSEAIGFFGWQSPGHPVQVRGRNLQMVESRPTFASSSEDLRTTQ